MIALQSKLWCKSLLNVFSGPCGYPVPRVTITPLRKTGEFLDKFRCEGCLTVDFLPVHRLLSIQVFSVWLHQMIQKERLKSLSSGLMPLNYESQYEKSHQNGTAESSRIDGKEMVLESAGNKWHQPRHWEYSRELSGRHPAEQWCASCDEDCGMKHSVSPSDLQQASHLHNEGSSVLDFFVCAEEFRGGIAGLRVSCHKAFPLYEVGYPLLV